MGNNAFYGTKMLMGLLKGVKLSPEEIEKVKKAFEKEITERPFRVAVIGQSGVGKTTTLNSVFGLDKYTARIAEGTKDVTEEIFEIRDGFKLSIYDMPGLGNDLDRDNIYEKMYEKILPQCDVIVYIISGRSKNIGVDCRILNNIVLRICKQNNILKNTVVAVNKIDTIGETIDRNDPELSWDRIHNCPTEKLANAITERLQVINHALVREHIFGEGALQKENIVYYSAAYNFNLRSFFMAILNTERGWIWATTVGFENIGKWSDKALNL